jgi:lipid-A-disaccharide synthase
MDELSVMGIAEVLPRYRHLMRRMAGDGGGGGGDAAGRARHHRQPRFRVPGGRRVRAASDVRIVHYVAPSVWAWRPGRARKVARLVDQF